MSPDEPPPSEGVPRNESAPVAGITSRTRRDTWFGENTPARKFFTRWGFPLFILFVAFLGRKVLLPFIFAFLISYILAPVVRWMSERRNGTYRMPRAVAIIICYIIFIAAINLFIIGSLPGIDNWGHIGGLVGGLMFTSFAGPLWEIEGVYPTYHLVDKRSSQAVIIGAVVVMAIFGALAVWGIVR